MRYSLIQYPLLLEQENVTKELYFSREGVPLTCWFEVE